MPSFYLPYGVGADRINGYAEKVKVPWLFHGTGETYMTIKQDSADIDHEELAERLKKTLYYGKTPTSDRPSLPLTEIAVGYLQEAAPRQLGRLTSLQAATTARQACVSPCSVMMGMLYVKRLHHGNSAYLQQISSSDLFLISMMMASKFLYDEGVDDEVFNDEWAAASDMETEDINELERNFLSAIDWQLFVKEHEFMEVLHQIEKRIALQQGVDRGWFTYTDLWVLSHDPHLFELWKKIATETTKVVIVSTVAYVASLLTVVGSTLALTTVSIALASVGPSVTQPQVPLPTPEIPAPKPIESVQNVSEPKETCNENCETSVIKNSLLSQLFAVITIPETLVQLIYGTRNKNETHKSFAEMPQSLCANGPCPFNSHKNCQNITSGSYVPTMWDSLSVSKDCSCGDAIKQDRCGTWNYCDKSRESTMNWNHVKCCCTNKGSEFLSPNGHWSLHDRFSDISLGFSTGRRLPALVQT